MRVDPGPHRGKKAYPLVWSCDVLHVADTGYEADRILKAGKVKVDGVQGLESHNYAVGLMDVVELAMGQAFQNGSKEFRTIVSYYY